MNVLWERRRGRIRNYTKAWDTWRGERLVGRCWDRNTADVGKVKVGGIVCNTINGGRMHD